jgi:hypothetical protein
MQFKTEYIRMRKDSTKHKQWFLESFKSLLIGESGKTIYLLFSHIHWDSIKLTVNPESSVTATIFFFFSE